MVKSDKYWGAILDEFKDSLSTGGKYCNLIDIDIYQKKRKTYVKNFSNAIKEACNRLRLGKNLLIIDKCANGKKQINEFRNRSNYNLPLNSIKVICAVPYVDKCIKLGKFSFASSSGLAFNCLARIINRENHETIKGDESSRALTLLNFLTSYKGKRDFIQVVNKDDQNVDNIIEVKYNNCGFDGDVPRILQIDLVDILSSSAEMFGLEMNSIIKTFVDDFLGFYDEYLDRNNGKLFGFEYTNTWENVADTIDENF